MQTCISIDGVIVPPEKAAVSILDHGFLYGDSVYETFRTYHGRLFLFSRHFERLTQGATRVFLRLPWTKDRFRKEIVRTIEAAGPGAEWKIRLIVTRGIGPMVADPSACSNPRVIIIVTPATAQPPELYTEGVDMLISSVRRGGTVAELKTGNLMHQVLATQEAAARGAYDAILLTDGGHLSDGIACNIYLVQDSTLKTPGREAAIIDGITRGVVLQLARQMGMTVIEGLLKPGEIARSNEMFFSSTLREIVPVVRVNGRAIGNGKPGPWTLRLLAAYRNAVEELLKED